ncbi:MAG: Uma2 family endonuclease [Pseudonocardia sp.]|nr:Uma2 family endonuclease [Pseudonocardia sp.]
MTAMTGQAQDPRISAEEFLAHDFPIGSELVDGVVHVNDPNFRHQLTCTNLILALGLWARSEAGWGHVGYGGNWVLSDGNVYKPDVWWAAEPPDGTRHNGPPDLAVEVRSPGTWRLDIGPKRDTYLAAGVRELWLVDTPAATVLVYRAGESLDDATEVGPGETLTSPLLPGFALAIDELFA